MPGPYPNLENEYRDKRPAPVGDNNLSKAPTWLNVNAKKIYRNTAAEIKKLGISDRCDCQVLAIYAMQLDRLQTVSQAENKEPKDQRLLNDLTSSVLSLSKELGITPSARAKLRIQKKEEADELDAFEAEADE